MSSHTPSDDTSSTEDPSSNLDPSLSGEAGHSTDSTSVPVEQSTTAGDTVDLGPVRKDPAGPTPEHGIEPAAVGVPETGEPVPEPPTSGDPLSPPDAADPCPGVTAAPVDGPNPEASTEAVITTDPRDVVATDDVNPREPTSPPAPPAEAKDPATAEKALTALRRKVRRTEPEPSDLEAEHDGSKTWPEPPVPASYRSWPSMANSRQSYIRNKLPWLGWKYSLLFPLALLLTLATVMWSAANRTETIELTILSSSSGEPLAGARVHVGDDVFVASAEGVARFERPADPTTLEVHAEGYIPVTGEVSETAALSQQVSLRPSTLVGRVTDEDTGEPVAGMTVSILDADGQTVASTSTDDSGTYRLSDVPEQASVKVDGGPYGSITRDIAGELEMSFPMTIRTATGIIRDSDGEPLQGAVVRSGEAVAVSAGDGSFLLDDVRSGAEITIQAPGFRSITTTVERGIVPEATLERQLIKAVYANANLLTSTEGIQQLVDIANETEINAIVIDVKEGTIFYDSEVAFFNEVGTIRPLYDVEAILQLLEDNDIYAIARMVVFQDPIVARERPDLAVKDVNGGLWLNVDGVAWVSAYNEELWDANIELAVELVERGFDEVQYDYVRFPSDGDLATADFGREYTAESREQAITEFMKRSHEAINDAGGYLAADLFGFITIVDEEQYIGQRFSMLAPHLDFVCMMIYPSHFETGNIASAPGHPNDFPYETIFESLQRAEDIVPGSSVKFRPWLQDFSYGFNGLRDYDSSDVRAQIDAAEDFGASGWMLWGDPFDVTVEALMPEPAA